MNRTANSSLTRVLFSFTTVTVWIFSLPGCFYAERNSYAASSNDACETEVPGPDEDIFTVQGKRAKIIDGDMYTCRKGKWVFNQTLIREKHVERRKTASGCEIVDTRTGQRQPLSSRFTSGFEVGSFLDVFGPEQWSGTTLLSPKANSVKKYVQLNKRILKGGKFLDNRIDLETDNVHSGRGALRFYAVSPRSRRTTSKSLVEKKNLCFGKGDDIWFSGWYYLVKGVPSTLVDFETRRMRSGPGIRLFIRKKKYASMELKFAHKPQYNQTEVPFPAQKWVNIKLHLKLSNHDDGLIEMWQDDVKILSMNGQTLPTHDTLYNVMQVGITATPMKAELIIDDISVSDKPL